METRSCLGLLENGMIDGNDDESGVVVLWCIMISSQEDDK